MSREDDVSSIDAIVAALYDTISGPAGARDWERENHLFLAGGRLVPTRPLPEGGAAADVFDTAGYRASREPFFLSNDFYEIEIGRRVDRFGSIAQVWSAYEARSSPDGPVTRRGINGIQLFFDGTRWWIVSILWDNEREGLSLPEGLLRGDRGARS
jgi:hypothetical protein